jgi:hypothetical protein
MFKALKEIRKPLAGGELLVTQFPVMRAIRTGARIAKIAAPVMGGFGEGINLDDLAGGSMQDKIENLDLDLKKAIPKALNALAMNLYPEDFAALCVELLSGATWIASDGKSKVELTSEAAINQVLGGELSDLFSALKIALEANDFFGLGAIGKLRGALGAPKKKKAIPENSTPA